MRAVYQRHRGCLTMALCRLLDLHPDDSCLPFGHRVPQRCRELACEPAIG